MLRKLLAGVAVLVISGCADTQTTTTRRVETPTGTTTKTTTERTTTIDDDRIDANRSGGARIDVDVKTRKD